MSKHRTTPALAVLGVAALAVVAGGCSQKYSAERDGKKLGQAICDVRDADNAEDAQAAVDDVKKELDDLGDKYAMYTAEDRADIDNNLADYAEHVVQGQPNLVLQDLTVLERSVDNIRDDVNETSRAAWEGLLEGLSDCTQDT